MLAHPKTAFWMVYDCDGLAFGRGDFVAAAFKIDGVVVIDSSRGPQREVEVEQCREGTGSEGAGFFQERLLPNGYRNKAGAAISGLILADDFHLENLVGMIPIAYVSVGHECNEAALKSAETSFDFPLGLRSWGDEMGNAQSAECALKLALGIGVVISGAWPKKTEPVGVNGQRNAMGFKCAAEV